MDSDTNNIPPNPLVKVSKVGGATYPEGALPPHHQPPDSKKKGFRNPWDSFVDLKPTDFLKGIMSDWDFKRSKPPPVGKYLKEQGVLTVVV
jgi:hypothetical protein